MAVRVKCEICESERAERIDNPWAVHCPHCGVFDYDISLARITSPEKMVRLSGWVREQNAAGEVPVRITPEILRRVVKMRVPGWHERALRVLSLIAGKFPRPGVYFGLGNSERNSGVLDYDELRGISYSETTQDLLTLFDLLGKDGFITTGDPKGYTLTLKGLLKIEQLQDSRPSSAQSFVAMWFNDSLKDAWANGFDPGIRAAGFRPFRIDNKEYVGGITDEIMAEIRRSRFVVADYTGQVNGVYFEAGFALGLGLTVIPTCRADDVHDLHFDIKHLNTLLWKSPTELAEGLNRRIRAVIGAGPDAADPN